jgi:hypothetical protein
MKRFLIKSIACLSLAILLAGILPFNTSHTFAADTIPSFIKSPNNNGYGYWVYPVGSTYPAGDPNGQKVTVEKTVYVDTKGQSITQDQYNAGPLNQTHTTEMPTLPSNATPAQIAQYRTDMANWQQENSSRLTTSGSQVQACTNGNLFCAAGETIVGIANAINNFFTNETIKVINWILFAIVFVLSKLLAIAGKLLDLAVLANMNINQYFTSTPAISDTWALLRDTFNIFFIFILLYISIRTILGIESKTKALLAKVVVSAIFINFSLFISKIIIDISNIFTVALYNQMGVTGTNTISSIMMDGLGLQSTFQATGDGLNAILIQVIQIILFSVLMWVFLEGALLLVVRITGLLFLMATSPIGFIGGMIPKIDEYTKKWWDNLNGLALTAPIFFFFMLILVKLIGISTKLFVNIQSMGTDIAITGKIDPSMFFMVAIFLTIAITAVKVTKKTSGEMGGMLSDFGKTAVGLGLGLATGGAAMLGRGVVGRVAANVANREGLKDAASKGGLGGIAARMTLRAADKTSKSTFDLRNTGLAGTVNKKLGIDLGKGGKGGFADKRKEYTEAQTKFAKENLSRDNLKEGQALEEHNKLNRNLESDLNEKRRQRLSLRTDLYNETDIKKRAELQKQLAEMDKDIATKKGTLDTTRLANQKDEFGNLIQSDEAQKARKQILEERKKAFQEQYAQSQEGSIINKALGRNKATSDKLRKDVVKGKTNEQKLADAAKAILDDEKKTGSTSSTQGTTPPASGGNPGGTTGGNPTP